MICKHVVRRPTVGTRSEKVDALCRAALHFHHVRHRMHCPSVLLVQGDGFATPFFGLFVLASLLKAECMHSFNEAITRYAVIPMRQHTRHAIAEHVGIAQREVAEMRILQSQQVARVLDRGTSPGLDATLPCAVEPGTTSCDMQALA